MKRGGRPCPRTARRETGVPPNALRWRRESSAQDLDPVRIEGETRGDLGDAGDRRLISPDCVVVAVVAVADREIMRLTLIGAGRGPLGALEQAHVDVLARNVGDRLVA